VVAKTWQAFVLAAIFCLALLPGAHLPDLTLDDAASDTLSAVCTNTIRLTQDCSRVDRAFLAPQCSRNDTALVVHRDFLLFDFKQNLRRWPVLSGNINRSPPSV
jgi:hypothetical protein